MEKKGVTYFFFYEKIKDLRQTNEYKELWNNSLYIDTHGRVGSVTGAALDLGSASDAPGVEHEQNPFTMIRSPAY